MASVNGISGGISSLAYGYAPAKSAIIENELNKFQNLADAIQLGNAAQSENSAEDSGGGLTISKNKQTKTIDKSSKLYEKSLELESYIIKIMLSSMRNTLTGNSLYGDKKSYAQSMYDDMFYDELSTVMTKNAGFGFADQVYLQLV